MTTTKIRKFFVILSRSVNWVELTGGSNAAVTVTMTVLECRLCISIHPNYSPDPKTAGGSVKCSYLTVQETVEQRHNKPLQSRKDVHTNLSTLMFLQRRKQVWCFDPCPEV